MSHFIFILRTGAQVSFVNHVEVQGKIKGVQYACASPLVSHLNLQMFTIFFGKEEPRGYDEVMIFFQTNGKASVQ